MTRKQREREAAVARLTRHYEELADRWPILLNDIPLDLYVKVNLPYCLRNLRDGRWSLD
jgi:hypothetical protein